MRAFSRATPLAALNTRPSTMPVVWGTSPEAGAAGMAAIGSASTATISWNVRRCAPKGRDAKLREETKELPTKADRGDSRNFMAGIGTRQKLHAALVCCGCYAPTLSVVAGEVHA